MDSRASDLNVNLDNTWIKNYSRMFKGASMSPEFEQAMDLRKKACIRHGISIETEDGAKIDPSDMIDGIVKKAFQNFGSKEICETVFAFDKHAGIEYLYDNEIFDPVMTVFGSINNPEFDAVKIAGEHTQYDMIRASRDQEKVASVEAKMGKEFADEFRANPIISLKKLGSPEISLLAETI